MKYFIISDIHGFYNAMLKSLRQAGFCKTNPNHMLIVCGDIFDRGPDPVKVYKFLKSIPKHRRILIRGNHEFLLQEAIMRHEFLSHDIHNGTDETVKQFVSFYYPSINCDNLDTSTLCNLFLNLGVLRWIFSDEWQNYYELGRYIFVHSWIPVTIQYNMWHQPKDYVYNSRWRSSNVSQWEEASWLCPWYCYLSHLYPKNKTIVCGHWYTSDFRKHILNDNIDNNQLFIYPNIIGLDACTAITHFCNVLVLNSQHKIENKH